MAGTWWKDEDDLSDEQASLLAIDEFENVLIKGPPGSGKTNLLLLRANQLYLGEHPNLHIVVFGGLLRTFIQSGAAKYKFPIDKIITHTRLFADILREEDADVDVTDLSFRDARKARASRLEELLQDGKIGVQFDALLLDEAQDYSTQEIKIIRQLSKVVVATADPRQKIYDVDDCISELEVGADHLHVLNHHFRNGREICELADGIMSAKAGYVQMLPCSNYDESEYQSKVEYKDGIDVQEQAKEIEARIANQIFAYPEDLIGVLTPRNDEADKIFGALSASAVGSEVTRSGADSFDSTKRVWVGTIAAAKGLEFRAVHIAGLDYLSSTGQKAQRRLIFTGSTRAKTSLVLYWHSSIPGYLESALRPFKPKSSVTMSKVFGKG